MKQDKHTRRGIDAQRYEGSEQEHKAALHNTELTDPEKDQEKLRGDEATIELPDVKDIPGQEFVQVPRLDAIGDTTISAADEEGEGLFIDDDEDTDIIMGTEADLTRNDRTMLQRADDYLPTGDEDRLVQASLDNTDLEGEPLNERSFGEERSGADLDVPGNNDVTRTDTRTQGDEENKLYSLGGDENEDNESRS